MRRWRWPSERCATKSALQRLVYSASREQFGLSAQMTSRAISTVREAYQRTEPLQRNRSKQPHFRPPGALVYDERMLAFPRIDRASLVTLDGRGEGPFRFGA